SGGGGGGGFRRNGLRSTTERYGFGWVSARQKDETDATSASASAVDLGRRIEFAELYHNSLRKQQNLGTSEQSDIGINTSGCRLLWKKATETSTLSRIS